MRVKIDSVVVRRMRVVVGMMLLLLGSVAGLSACSMMSGETNAEQQNDVQFVSKDTPERRSAIEAAEARAKQFVACLVESGIEADVAEDNDTYVVSGQQYKPKTLVIVRMLDAAGNPAYAGEASGLYPDLHYTHIGDGGDAWIYFKDSTHMMGTPYAGRQAAYQACERKNPEFEQADLDAMGVIEYPEEAWQASLEYARDCRAKGFSWVKDPVRGNGDKPGEGPGVFIPNGISDEEFLRWLEECPVDGLPHLSATMIYSSRGNNYDEILRQYELEHQE
ncbi:hypothetical protein [Bifidobacterium leontopitheci]|uniref:Uridine kinase n=1 Tax=Bifidobacterium leontopitheci TaxID=2650774 RepID=A0A6I1GNX9_9BIFI|nr:hypothetical protein [Bifidobacterium leontopitheci]KAB7789778.1 hypothetical protein F7D09_1723 [Bifidobacterium leontopitheci]